MLKLHLVDWGAFPTPPPPALETVRWQRMKLYNPHHSLDLSVTGFSNSNKLLLIFSVPFQFLEPPSKLHLSSYYSLTKVNMQGNLIQKKNGSVHLWSHNQGARKIKEHLWSHNQGAGKIKEHPTGSPVINNSLPLATSYPPCRLPTLQTEACCTFTHLVHGEIDARIRNDA